MSGPCVVLFESDPNVARSLAGGLRSHFQSVHVTRSRDEVRDKVSRTRPEALILNIEHSPLNDIELLRQEFPALPIVCTHRIPDEEMWMAALDAGATDVCPADDVQNVLTSVLRSLGLRRTAAA